jgi:putative Mg2+ transporter-C (MgtC) family protein
MVKSTDFRSLKSMSPDYLGMTVLRNAIGAVLSTTITRLVVAAALGAVIGLEREWRHKPAGLRTNLFICFGSALFTVLSSQLAGSPGEYTRIASNIITGVGFIGAGSILHSRASVTGLTTAATIFVAAAVGMAAGGGLYITAVFSTIVILVALAILGRLEGYFETKSRDFIFEVEGPGTDAVLVELNRILDGQRLIMQDVHTAPIDDRSRLVFKVHSGLPEKKALELQLHQSPVFGRIQYLGGQNQHE